MKRISSSMVAVIAMVMMLASPGHARTSGSRCPYLHEHNGCVLKNGPDYYGSSQGAHVRLRDSSRGTVVGVMGGCPGVFDNIQVKHRNITIGMSISLHNATGGGDASESVSGSIKVVSAKQSTAHLTESVPATGSNRACTRTLDVVLKRQH